MNAVLYIIAFLEGFTTLSVEIMSIRNSVAIIGSNSIATSIILGIILLALSYGYYRGGLYASVNKPDTIKKKVYWNLLLASIFYTCVSFPFENYLLNKLLELDIGYFLPIFIGISVLFFLPVFLASQTIPLLSELVTDKHKAAVIGKLLFLSTIGSFIGSVATSLIFFSFIGVERSIVVNGIILALLAFAMLFQFRPQEISQRRVMVHLVYLLSLIYLFFIDYNVFGAESRVYRYSSEYNDIEVFDDTNQRTFMMNKSLSSGLDVTTGKSFFSYIQEVTGLIEEQKPKKILVIGAAGFSLPQDVAKRDFVERVDVCDIDGSLDTIAETYFLKEKLHPKIVFYKESARYFINKKIKEGEKYDFIFIDAYNGKISIPSELLTQEFFEKIERLSSSTIAINLILDSGENSVFYKKLMNTINSVLENSYIVRMNPFSHYGFDNFILTNQPFPEYKSTQSSSQDGIYTDNMNTLEIDKYKLFYSQKEN